MAAPTDREWALIAQLKDKVWNSLVTEEHRSDWFILRWIRGSEYDLEKAEKRLRDTLKWRAEHYLDSMQVSQFPPPNPWFVQNFPWRIVHSDKFGRPVLEIPVGSWPLGHRPLDSYGQEVDDKEFEYYVIYCLEILMDSIRAANRANPHLNWPITQCVVIMDWEGFHYSYLLNSKALQVPLRFAEFYEKHYAETGYRCHMINCPAGLPILFALYKTVLGTRSLNSICWHRGGEEEWKPLLLKEIGEENLPEKYGGKGI